MRRKKVIQPGISRKEQLELENIVENNLKNEETVVVKNPFKIYGVCLRVKDGEQIYCSSFRNKREAEATFKIYKDINVVDPKKIIYKCPECCAWHIGFERWS